MREIVLDTETTGFDPLNGDRIVEIACLELENYVPSGESFHCYVNPERDVPEQAFLVHGLSAEFLSRHRVFADVADEFLGFIRDDPLIIHNAEFDIGFLNAELQRVGRPSIALSRAVDTVLIARRRYPGAQASLDALCRRFEIDLTGRAKHGALIDCGLLARVYLELRGGSQPSLGLIGEQAAEAICVELAERSRRPPRPARPHEPSAAELAAHRMLLEKLSEPIWSI